MLISRINRRISNDTVGRPQQRRDFQRQYSLKPARCQRIPRYRVGRLQVHHTSWEAQADTSQYQPVNRRKSKSLGIGTPQHIDLLPQQQNLRLEHCARPQQIGHCPKNQFAQIKH